MIKQLLEEELAYERMQLKKINKKRKNDHGAVLSSSRGYFYYKPKGKKHRIYIRKGDQHTLHRITADKYREKKYEILIGNIAALEKALKLIRNTEDEEIIKVLPKACREAIGFLRSSEEGSAVIQSQNNYCREELTVTVSNGLKVRTREELIIAEILIELGIKFQYEKALTLTETVELEDGTVIRRYETVYPDFTIFLADGSEFYLEHCGMLSDRNYRERFFRKLRLYFENGIHSPRNLLLTMAGNGMPLDTVKLRHVIVTQILPLCSV